jgi:hypothetical protein
MSSFAVSFDGTLANTWFGVASTVLDFWQKEVSISGCFLFQVTLGRHFFTLA